MEVRPADDNDRAAIEAFLPRRHSLRVARRGVLEEPLNHPALVAEADRELVAVLTYVIHGADCEILTLHSDERRSGVGTGLIEALAEVARRAGCERLWLVTTNDNVDALRFYQRRGFRLRDLRPGAVDRSRAELKPEIPRTGEYGIPIHDELELEMRL